MNLYYFFKKAVILLQGFALALNGLNVQAQKISTNLTGNKIMTKNENQRAAFFYQDPVILDREKHKNFKIKEGNAQFALKSPLVPLLASEFTSASQEYPILFSKDANGQWMALALTAVQDGNNTFVNADGIWKANYVPASIRRYPFILADQGNGQMSLAADLKATHFGDEGEALFDDKGEPTEFTRNLLPMLADFQNQILSTAVFLTKLDDAGLLTQQNFEIKLADMRTAQVTGLWLVDEALFRQLPDEKVTAWFRQGELAVVYAHLLSLRNLPVLLERVKDTPALAVEKMTQEQTNAPSPSKGNKK
jgi:hypothetical protein